MIFGINTGQTIRRSAFASVEELVASISTFIDGWNDGYHPCVRPARPLQAYPGTPPRRRKPPVRLNL
jgi:hypothetical protein